MLSVRCIQMCCLGQVIDTPMLAELVWTVAADLKEMGLLGEEVLGFFVRSGMLSLQQSIVRVTGLNSFIPNFLECLRMECWFFGKERRDWVPSPAFKAATKQTCWCRCTD